MCIKGSGFCRFCLGFCLGFQLRLSNKELPEIPNQAHIQFRLFFLLFRITSNCLIFSSMCLVYHGITQKSLQIVISMIIQLYKTLGAPLPSCFFIHSPVSLISKCLKGRKTNGESLPCTTLLSRLHVRSVETGFCS